MRIDQRRRSRKEMEKDKWINHREKRESDKKKRGKESWKGHR